MANFASLINSGKPVLVDFSAEWCGPCKLMPPILKKVKDNLGEKVSIYKIDIDKNRTVADTYNVRSVPTLILFRNGEVRWRQSGVVQADFLREVIESNS